MSEAGITMDTQMETDGVFSLQATDAEVPAVMKQEDLLEPVTENIFRRHIKEDPRKKLLAKHRLWMDNLQHEYPLPFHPYKIGVFVRYYNQTRHSDYLEKHIAQFKDDIALCPSWTLVDFYIERGMTAPRMENAKEWCRLLGDCFAGKVNLIVTQKVSNVSNDADEVSFIVRTLAAQKPPVGIYFISEDIFSLASYYRHDLLDRAMLPSDQAPLPPDELDVPMIYEAEDRKLLDSKHPEPMDVNGDLNDA
ncbi:MAG: recombinase family protein [Anaerolineaceae bacterium]|nr:recombinase family protein [Anaerolineaceae bacterium]